MQTIQLTSHIGEDGLLSITVPEEWKGRDVEILVVMQPATTTLPKTTSRWAKIARRVHEDTRYSGGWSESLKRDMREFRENFNLGRDGK